MEDQMQKRASEDYSQDFGDTSDDVLSLCDLPIHGYEYQDSSRHGTRRPSVSSDQESFEFNFADFGSVLSRSNSCVFSGDKFFDDQTGQVNEFQKRDYFSVRSASLHKVSAVCGEEMRKPRSRSLRLAKTDPLHSTASLPNVSAGCGEEMRKLRSSSLRLAKTDPLHSKMYNPVQNVNITAITAMSAKSRRRMFMFGPVKFKPEMDVNAIRRRRGRLPPLQIPPIPEGSEIAEERGGRRKSGGDGGLARPPLACRSHIAAVLARSFSCMSMVSRNDAVQ